MWESLAACNSEGDDVPIEFEENMEVLELSAIEKELCLVQSWIKLASQEKNFLTPLSAEETVALLVRHSMYDSVVQLCALFNLNKAILFENVTLACCKVNLCFHMDMQIAQYPSYLLIFIQLFMAVSNTQCLCVKMVAIDDQLTPL